MVFFGEHNVGSAEKKYREVSTHVNYISYSDVEELDTGADLIIVGKPLKEFDEREQIVKFTEPNDLIKEKHIADYYSINEIEVSKILKNDKGFYRKSVDVIEPVAIVDYYDDLVKLKRGGYNEMQKDTEYIIFLQKNSYGEYSVINLNEGKFNLDDTDNNELLVSSHDTEHNHSHVVSTVLKEQVMKKYNLK